MLRPSTLASVESPPRGVHAPTRATWIVAFALLFVAVTVIKVLLITTMGLELSFDEAYYWHWSQNLDWCYFSKGPGIAALIRGATAIFGDSEFGIRSGALACSSIVLVVLFCWARRFFNCDRTAFIAVLLAVSAPMYLGSGVLTTIDSPLLACWMVATASAWFAVQSSGLFWWIALGLAVAVGTQFKFTMLFFVASVALLLARSVSGRRSIHRAGPAVAALIVGASMIPILVWNANHGWITFFHTVDKATTGLENSIINGRHVVPSIVQQLGVMSPVLCIGLFVAIALLVRDCFGRPRDRARGLERPKAWFLLAMCLPMFAFYAVLSLHRMIEPNWLAAAYLALLPAAAFYWTRPFNRLQRATLVAAILVGIATQSLVFTMDSLYRFDLASRIFSPETGLKPKLDVTNRLHGWRQLAQTVADEARQIEQSTGAQAVILADHYSYAAWIGYYARMPDRVFVIPSGRPHNQFDLWALNGRTPKQGSAGIVAYELERSGRDASFLFGDFQILARTFPIHRGKVVIRNARIDLGRNFQEARWWESIRR